MDNRFVITGGLGFIGSAFSRLALEHDWARRITIVDKLTYAACTKNIPEKFLDRIDLVVGDICDPDVLCSALTDDTNALFHFAAESHVDRSISNGVPFIQTNVMGTQIVLQEFLRFSESALSTDRARPRMVHVSTDEVYGALGATGSFSEDTPLAPNSPYSASKASSDFLVRAFYHTFQLPVVTTRCSNNYGPCQFPEKFIPRMIQNALGGIALPVYGQGLNVRDWLHVDDHCAGIYAAFRKGQSGEVYNLGGDSERRNIDIARLILKTLDKPQSGIEFVTDRKGHDFRYAVNFERARRELDWHPTISFERGLQQTIEWYLKNQAWAAAIQAGEYQQLDGWNYRKVGGTL